MSDIKTAKFKVGQHVIVSSPPLSSGKAIIKDVFLLPAFLYDGVFIFKYNVYKHDPEHVFACREEDLTLDKEYYFTKLVEKYGNSKV
jgi:hypothetical protein